MKKLMLIFATVAFIGIGGSAVSAQSTDPDPLPGAPVPLPTECSENDQKVPPIGSDGVPANCVQYYFEEVVVPPAPTTTTTVPVTIPDAGLPATGSAVSPIVSIGALLLIGGGIVVIASRRRSTAAIST